MKSRQIKPARFINSKVIATISISLVLTLLGLIILLVLLANNLSTEYKESLAVEVYLNDEMSNSEILEFQNQLNKARYTKTTQYISKEDALLFMEKDLGINPTDISGYNPFPASIVINLNAEYSDIDSLSMIELELSSLSNNIKSIEYEKELTQFLNENIKKVSFILFSFSILLLIISFALINNTIRLMIYSKRFLIHTMKLVGAKNSFIRGPFLRTNIIMGIIAAFIGMGLIYIFLNYLSTTGNVDLVSAAITGISMLILGIIIPIVASYFAVNKYLRMRSNDLYYI
ncbi:permease-like cell division protein FtsX [Bacteroidales bacterium OttesenSCG-928-M11]|nr:permease-like cell division protein FtsX [Bacteroidales bacterium OttesenSCG-928-M11]